MKNLCGEAQTILAVTARVVTDGARVRERVFYHDRPRADKCMATDTAELVNARKGAERRVIFYDDVTGKRSAVCEYDVIAYVAIVRDVRLRHEEIIGADLSNIAAAFGPAMQSRELTKRVALARAQPAPLAAILQIMRHLSSRYEWEKDRAAPEFRRAFDDAMARHAHIVVQYHVVAYDRVRSNGDIAPKLGIRADDGCRVDRHVVGNSSELLLYGGKCGAVNLVAALDDAAVYERG